MPTTTDNGNSLGVCSLRVWHALSGCSRFQKCWTIWLPRDFNSEPPPPTLWEAHREQKSQDRIDLITNLWRRSGHPRKVRNVEIIFLEILRWHGCCCGSFLEIHLKLMLSSLFDRMTSLWRRTRILKNPMETCMCLNLMAWMFLGQFPGNIWKSNVFASLWLHDQPLVESWGPWTVQNVKISYEIHVFLNYAASD